MRGVGDSTGVTPLAGVDRALAILTFLGEAGPSGATLTEIATALKQNKATAHRTLAALRHRRFAIQGPDGRYRLGPGSISLATGFFAIENLPVLLAPALAFLGATTSELVHVGVLAGAEVVYIDKIDSPRAMRVWSQVGGRAPVATTALGRAIVAFRPNPEPIVDVLIRYLELDEQAGARLHAHIAQARRTGYAEEADEYQPGVTCVAVPIIRDNTSIAAISITAPSARFTPDRRREAGELMLRDLPALMPTGLSVAAS